MADAYDILVSESAYRKGIPHKEAIRNILEGKSGAFNQLCWNACLTDRTESKENLDARCQMPDGIKFDCCPKISNFSEK